MAEVERAWCRAVGPPRAEDDDRAKRSGSARPHSTAGARRASASERRRAWPRSTRRSRSKAKGTRRSTGGPSRPPGAVHVAPGEHQLVVRRRGDVVWADWVALSRERDRARGRPRRRAVLGRGPRARRSFDGGFAASGSPLHFLGGSEPRLATGRYVVAVCDRDACSTPFEWRSGPDPSLADAAAAEPRGHPFPAWATWTIVGAAGGRGRHRPQPSR